MQWTTEDITTHGVRQRGFRLEVDGRTVPGLLWTPDEGAPAPPGRPLVALGHGASSDKRQDVVVSMARRLVRHHQMAAVAIDGPVHGDRRPDRGRDSRLTFVEFAQQWSLAGDVMTDAMVADWRATIDALQGGAGVGQGPVGWWGVSMGTIIGLPVVASEPQILACVLGLMGLTGPTRERIATDVRQIHCPVLFLMQWDDEIFPRADALALFGAFPGEDKRLHAHPGRHGALPGEALDASARFLARALG